MVVAGDWVMPRLDVSLRSRFQTLSSPELDVGTRISRRVFAADVGAVYGNTAKTSTELNLHTDSTTYNGGALNNETYTVGGFLNYRFRPKLELSVGFNVGLLEVESSPNQYFQQGLLRARWYPTDKLSVSLLGGLEQREIDGGDNRTDPIFTLNLSYQPRERTTFYLRAERRAYNSSSLDNENFDVTTFSASVRQEFFAHMDFVLSVAYSYSNYYSTVSNVTSSRIDNVFEVSPTIGMNVTRWSRLELSYQFRENNSTEVGASFTENVGRLDLKMLF